jgi:hypothetical protein
VAGAWLRDHPGIEVLCRDGSGAYGEAARRAVPQAAQVSDRWHLWHLLGGVAAGDARTPRGVAGAGKFARQAVAASYRAP